MRNSNWLQTAHEEISRARSAAAMGDVVASYLLSLLEVESVEVELLSNGQWLRRCKGRGVAPRESSLFERGSAGECLFAGRVVTLPLVLSQRKESPRFLVPLLERRGLSAMLVLPVLGSGGCIGWVSICSSHTREWSGSEIAEVGTLLAALTAEIGKFSAPAQSSSTDGVERAEDRELFDRLVQLGNLFIIELDGQQQVRSIRGNVKRLLGISPERLIQEPALWTTVVDEDDYQEFIDALRQSTSVGAFSREVKVTHAETKESRYLLVKAVRDRPAESSPGWEIFGFDITEKHRTEKELVWERKRVEALYEVSRTVQGATDPAIASLKGIRSLVRATKSDCGLAAFYDPDGDSIEIVAAEGFTEESVSQLSKLVSGRSLMRIGIESADGLIVNDLEQDERVAAPEVMRQERLRSAIIVPLMLDDRPIGALALYSKKRGRFREADRELIEAAARQIGFSVRHAEFLAQERSQAAMVTALYHLSHELGRLLTPREMAAHAFPIINSALACKRLWFGVMNDQGSHLIGQAGMGPGVRRSVIEMQIDLAERHDVIDEAIRTREPTLLLPDVETECSSLNRLRERLGIGVAVVVPLSSLNQVIGVLILEPTVPSVAVIQRKLPLLKSMATEMATVIVARRFESKMAEADKMRMAGMLASGVAHNFNNLLQTIMGQASIIEVQSKGTPVASAVQLISESAKKGASLVGQLLGFSNQGNSVRRALSLNDMLKDSTELYRSILGPRTQFSINLDAQCPPVYADKVQVQQVVTNLLLNARDAVRGKEDAQVSVSTTEMRIRSGEIDPDLAPGIYLRIDVSDNGVGMDAERVARCFEPFYSTKNLDSRTGISLTGAGLGLSSAYSIIKGHEGLIAVRSRVGQGTVFSIYLPGLTVKREERPESEKVDEQILGTVVVVGVEVSPELERKVLASRFRLQRVPATVASSRTGTGPRIVVLNSQQLSEGALREEIVRNLDDRIMVLSPAPEQMHERLMNFAPEAECIAGAQLADSVVRAIEQLTSSEKGRARSGERS